MIYDSFTLAACTKEMRSLLPGMIVHQVRQPDDLTVILVCRSATGHADVLFSAHPRYARTHLCSARYQVPSAPPGFCQLLRKHLEGTRVKSVDQIGVDRVLRVTFQSNTGAHPALMHEIMGKHSNTVLLSDDERIWGAIKIVGAKLSRVRQILPGRDYALPPSSKLDPSEITYEQFESRWQEAQMHGFEPAQARKWLVEQFAGVSPTLAAEVVARAQTLSAEALYSSVSDMFRAFHSGAFSPVIIRNPDKGYEEVYPLPLQHLPSSWQHGRATISEALEATIRAEIGRSEAQTQRDEIQKSLQRTRSRLVEDSDQLLDIIQHPELGEEMRRKGEILTGNFHAIPSGTTSVDLLNYYDPEMKPITIELVGELSPHENVERYFRQARKADDRLASATQRRPALLEQIQQLDDAMERLRSAGSTEDIERLRADLTAAGLLYAAQVHQDLRPEERPFKGLPIRSVTSRDGYEILYGETAEANDHLTARVARPDDVWLHARAITGAHVVIRAAGRPGPVPQGTLREAAIIAARHSQAKHSSYVPVDWTLRKHVRKPRKAAPGLVTYTHEKTIDVTDAQPR